MCNYVSGRNHHLLIVLQTYLYCVVSIQPQHLYTVEELVLECNFRKFIEEGKSLREMEYFYSDNAHLNKVIQKIVGYIPSKIFNDVACLDNGDVSISYK